MKPLFGIPVSLLLALSLVACSDEAKPPPPKPKPAPVALVKAFVDDVEVGPTELLESGTRVVVSGEESVGKGDLTYHWTLRAPQGSQAKFLFEGLSRNAFVVDAGGPYVVELVVEDANGESEPATAEVKVAYAPPVAVLKLSAPEPTIALDHEVVADGSGSHDPSGQPLTYVFRLTQRPSGSNAVIESNGSSATFMPDRGGTYEVGLRVRNETTIGEEVTQSIVVQPPRNRPPTAVAGNDFGAPVGGEVVLDGSRSLDPDGDELTYTWRLVEEPEGSEATLENADEKIATFVPNVEGAYVVELTVSDGEYESKDSVTVTAKETPNVPPQITVIRVDDKPLPVEGRVNVELGAVVPIEIQVFDPDPGAEITVRWELVTPEGSAASLVEVSKLKRTLEADIDGIYTVIVTANDGEFDSPQRSFEIRFIGDNRFPVAVIDTADGEVQYPNGTKITLDASGSYDTDDPEDPINYYRWRLLSQPSGLPHGVLADEGPQFRTVTFDLTKKGSYVFELTVQDDRDGVSEPATLEITSMNRPPVARAVTPPPAPLNKVHLSRLENEHPATDVVLNGNGGNPSFDPDPGDEPLNFFWEIVDQPAGSNPCLRQGLNCGPTATNEATGFFTDSIGTYQVQLTVTDRDPNPASHSIIIEVVIE